VNACIEITGLPDGRYVEFVAAEWATDLDSPSDPPGTIHVRVQALVDGHLHEEILLWDSARIEAAYQDVGNAD
jgi:hypothetical protein